MNVTGHRSVDGVRAYKQMSEEQHQEVCNMLQVSNKKPRVMSDADATAVVPFKAIVPQEQENVFPVPTALQQEPAPTIPSQQHENVAPVQGKTFGFPAMHITGCSVVIFTTGEQQQKPLHVANLTHFARVIYLLIFVH